MINSVALLALASPAFAGVMQARGEEFIRPAAQSSAAVAPHQAEGWGESWSKSAEHVSTHESWTRPTDSWTQPQESWTSPCTTSTTPAHAHHTTTTPVPTTTPLPGTTTKPHTPVKPGTTKTLTYVTTTCPSKLYLLTMPLDSRSNSTCSLLLCCHLWH